MVILQDFLSEAEVMDMPFETLEAFVQTFSQEMYKPLMEYMDSPDSNQEVVQKLHECVGSVVVRNTFHYKVADRGIKSTVYNCRMKSLPELIYGNKVNVDTVIQDLEWLEANTDNLTTSIPAQTKDSFERALALIKEYEANPEYAHENEIYKNMLKWKTILFLPSRRMPQKTGMSSLSLNKSRWRMQLRAAKYLKYCVDKGISMEVSREV